MFCQTSLPILGYRMSGLIGLLVFRPPPVSGRGDGPQDQGIDPMGKGDICHDQDRAGFDIAALYRFSKRSVQGNTKEYRRAWAAGKVVTMLYFRD
jgi:hypothetical protein